MDKPSKKTRTFYDYHECCSYLEEKYGYDERDYGGQHTGDGFDFDKPHRDFWHLVLDRGYVENNGTFFDMTDEWLDDDCYDTEWWQKEIIERYLDEFGEEDENGFRTIEFWVSW